MARADSANGCLLPMGPLREPLSRLATVSAVICNGGEALAGEHAMQLVVDVPRRVIDDVPLDHALGPQFMRWPELAIPPLFCNLA